MAGAEGVDVSVTMSFGVARISPALSFAKLIDCADQALYTSKESGRNRVTQWQGDPEEASADAGAEPG